MTSQCGEDGLEDELDQAITLTATEQEAALSDAIERIKLQELTAAAQREAGMDSLDRSPDTINSSAGEEPSPEPLHWVPQYNRPPSKFSQPPLQSTPLDQGSVTHPGSPRGPAPGVDDLTLKRMEDQLRENREKVEMDAAVEAADSVTHQHGSSGTLHELVSGWDEERQGYKKVIASLSHRVEELQRLQGDGKALTTVCDWNDVAAHHAAQLHWWLSERDGYVQNVAALESQVGFLTRRVAEADAVAADQAAAIRRLQRRVAIQDANFETIQKAYQGTLRFNQEIET